MRGIEVSMAITARRSRPVPPRVVDDINLTLDKLRFARELDPEHDPRNGGDHILCEVCFHERRLNDLLDNKIPRKASK